MLPLHFCILSSIAVTFSCTATPTGKRLGINLNDEYSPGNQLWLIKLLLTAVTITSSFPEAWPPGPNLQWRICITAQLR